MSMAVCTLLCLCNYSTNLILLSMHLPFIDNINKGFLLKYLNHDKVLFMITCKAYYNVQKAHTVWTCQIEFCLGMSVVDM